MPRLRTLSPIARNTARILAKTHSQDAIATAFGVSPRTIHRALASQQVAPGRGYRKVRAAVSPVARIVATAKVLLGK